MQRTTIITAIAHESRKSLQFLEALSDARAADATRSQADPLNGVILRRRRNLAVLRTLSRAEGGERTQPPAWSPAQVDADMVIAAEARLLAHLERQLARPDLPDDLRALLTDHREDVLQAVLILPRIRDRNT